MAKRSKRRSQKTPNLPQSAIDRARRQIKGELEEGEDTAPEQQVVEEVEDDMPAAQNDALDLSAPRRDRRRERARSEPIQYSRRNKKEELTSAEVADILANPTKFVTEEELRAEYHHVIADLRSMGLLAAALMVALVVLAQFI